MDEKIQNEIDRLLNRKEKKDRHCPYCGRSIPFESKMCPYCQKELN